MNRKTKNILAAAVISVSIVGCKTIPELPEGGAALYGTAKEFIISGLERLKRKQYLEAEKDFNTALGKIREAEGKQNNRESWYVTRIQQLEADNERANRQYNGAFKTMGVISAVWSMVGVFLLVSGLLRAYPRAGIAAIASGALGVAYSFIAPELANQSPYLIFGIYSLILGAGFCGLVYIAFATYRAVKKQAIVIHREKMGEGNDATMPITEIAREEFDPVTKAVVGVARRQLHEKGVIVEPQVVEEHVIKPGTAVLRGAGSTTKAGEENL